jgi:hypothetical protein
MGVGKEQQRQNDMIRDRQNMSNPRYTPSEWGKGQRILEENTFKPPKNAPGWWIAKPRNWGSKGGGNNNQVGAGPDYITDPVRREPWFPGIDSWFAKISYKWHFLLAVVGAIGAWLYAYNTGANVVQDATLGFFGGLLLITLLAYFIKAVIVLAVVGAIVGVGYVLLEMSTHH